MKCLSNDLILTNSDVTLAFLTEHPKYKSLKKKTKIERTHHLKYIIGILK